MSRDVVIDYTNWRGERRARLIKPLAMVWDLTEWHLEPQWLVWAFSMPNGDLRAFAMASIHSWTPVVDDEEDGDAEHDATRHSEQGE